MTDDKQWAVLDSAALMMWWYKAVIHSNTCTFFPEFVAFCATEKVFCSFETCTPSLDPFAFETAVYFITEVFRSIFLGFVLENSEKGRAGNEVAFDSSGRFVRVPRSGWVIGQEVIKTHTDPAVSQCEWQRGPGEDPGGKLYYLYSIFISLSLLKQPVYWKLHGIAAYNDELPVYTHLNVTKLFGASWTSHLPWNFIRNKSEIDSTSCF